MFILIMGLGLIQFIKFKHNTKRPTARIKRAIYKAAKFVNTPQHYSLIMLRVHQTVTFGN